MLDEVNLGNIHPNSTGDFCSGCILDYIEVEDLEMLGSGRLLYFLQRQIEQILLPFGVPQVLWREEEIVAWHFIKERYPLLHGEYVREPLRQIPQAGDAAQGNTKLSRAGFSLRPKA